jgi:hypothetical protein
MTDHVPGGCVLLANKIFQSALWRKPPQYLRSFLWLIGKAAFEDGHTFKGHILKRGELITTHNEIADGLSYCFNRAIIKPSQKEIRIMLSWLQSEGMILMKPLIDGTSPNKGRPIELTRAYIGLLIYIINYDTYQDLKSYKGMDKGRPSSEQGQLREIRENKIFLSDSLEIRLAELLLEKILTRNPNHKKPNLQTWARDIDRMIRLDHRAPDDIRSVIEWCQADTFWQNNILSVDKLRKQFDQLALRMGNRATDPHNDAPSVHTATCPDCRRTVLSSEMAGAVCILCAEVQAHA